MNTVQDLPVNSGTKLAAMLSAALLTIEASNIPLADAFGMARNIINDGEGYRPEFKATTQFIQEELLK